MPKCPHCQTPLERDGYEDGYDQRGAFVRKVLKCPHCGTELVGEKRYVSFSQPTKEERSR